jgi:peptidyl-prolyl cis-trans isomerase SurA
MVKETIKMKIGRDSRSELNKSAVLKRIQSENNYTVNHNNLNQFISSLPDTAMFFNWKPDTYHKSNAVLFTIGDKTFTCSYFSTYIKSVPQSPSRNPNESMANIVKLLFDSYADNKNFEYEESILELKYDDFKYLMQEYRDGILLFELSNKTVWNKASEDTAGLKAFFEGRRANYQWSDRAVTKTYVCSSKSAAKTVKKYLKKDSSDKAILLAVNQEDALGVNIVYKTYEKGQDKKIDKLDWNKSIHKVKDKTTKKTEFVKIEKLLPPGQKELKETLGPVTSDYQKYLEDQWIEDLKLKYPVVLFDGALEQLFLDKK